MKKEFNIAWKSKTTGATGRGTEKLDVAEAVKAANDLDKKWPELSHWVIHCDYTPDVLIPPKEQ